MAAAKPQPDKPGLASRRLALSLLEAVLVAGQPLDDAFDGLPAPEIDPRDRAFAHAMAATALRRKGEAGAHLKKFLAKPLPKSSGQAALILLLGVVQLKFLAAPAHAVIDLAVTQAQGDLHGRHFAKLINAVLRKVAADTTAFDAAEAAKLNTPDWLMKSWAQAHGAAAATDIAIAHLAEAAIDLSVKGDPEAWAARLDGLALPTGSVRLREAGDLVTLPGFAEGEWWVQDAAAALPVKLVGDVSGRSVLDLCAAPGGKTAQLASRGAVVTAADHAAVRLDQMKANLARLGLSATLRETDVFAISGEPCFDAVLLDAPCSATGTIRRHPDLPHLKSPAQVSELAALQARMLDHAATLVKPGGLLLYCTCSLQAEEGEMQARDFLTRHSAFSLMPATAAETGGQAAFVSPEGFLRTLPFMRIGEARGLDGFFAARFRRR